MIARQVLRGPDGAPFLRRWVLRLGPIRLYLHNFLGDDPRPAYHSHPFTGLSLVLRGAYVETTPVFGSRPAPYGERFRIHSAPGINVLGRAYHRTEMLLGCKSCWTLMLAWQPKGRAWGFLLKDGRRVDSEAAWAEGLRLAPEPGVRR